MVALQGVDALHLVGGELEVEDVVVLGDMGGIAATGNSDSAALEVPAQKYLIRGLSVSLSNRGDDLVLRERLDACAAAAEGEPSLEHGAEFGNMRLHRTALVVGMRLVLQ